MKWIRTILKQKPKKQNICSLEAATRSLLGQYSQTLTKATTSFCDELKYECLQTYKFIQGRLLHSLKLKEEEYNEHRVAMALLQDSIDSLAKSLPLLKPKLKESLLASMRLFTTQGTSGNNLLEKALLSFPQTRLEACEVTEKIQNLGIALNARLSATETIIHSLETKSPTAAGYSDKEPLALERIKGFYAHALHVRDLLHKRFLLYTQYSVPHLEASLRFGKKLLQ